MRIRVRFVPLLGTLAIALSACGGGTSSSAASGATLVEARVKDAVHLDPALATDGLSLNITQELFQNLVRFKTGSFEIVPGIADSWKISRDGKTYTFRLKANQKFSDGTALDAEAVKFNFDRWRLKNDPYHGNQPFQYYVDMFGGLPGRVIAVKADSPTQVTITLDRPVGPFLHDLAMPSFAIGAPDAIKKDANAYDQKPVASGPYMVQEWVKDDHITLVANPHYTGPKPAYSTVIIRDIPDQATSVLSLQKGDIDILTDPRPDDAKSLASQSGIAIYQQPSNNNSYLALNVEKPPFDKLAVRRAVAYALDLPAIVNGLYSKGAQVANNWTPPGMLGENKAVVAYPHDPAKARALLAQAGFPNGFKTQLWYGTAPRPYLPEPQRVAEAIQAQLKAAGIDATLTPYEWGVYLSKIRNGEQPMCLIGWSGDNGDPDNFFYPLLDKDSAHKPNAQNYSFWKDEAFHKLMIAGQTQPNDKKRADIYKEANEMVHDQVPAIPIVHTTVPFAAKSSIKGIVPNPDTHLQFELMSPG